jgi:hypothetical protein
MQYPFHWLLNHRRGPGVPVLGKSRSTQPGTGGRVVRSSPRGRDPGDAADDQGNYFNLPIRTSH